LVNRSAVTVLYCCRTAGMGATTGAGGGGSCCRPSLAKLENMAAMAHANASRFMRSAIVVDGFYRSCIGP
jgi:hypothetical protein